MIFDSDVIIWALRGSEKAGKRLDGCKDKAISIITYMELLRGAGDKFNALEIKRIIKKYDFKVIPVNENISHRALIYIETHGLKSGISVTDAMIAATAAEKDMTLCAGNYKDYKYIQELELDVFKV